MQQKTNLSPDLKSIAIVLAVYLLLGTIFMTSPVREENTRTTFVENSFQKTKPLQFHSDSGEDKHNLKPTWYRDALLIMPPSYAEGFSMLVSRSLPFHSMWINEKILTFLFPFHAFP